MFKVSAAGDRNTAERLADLLTVLDPSPAQAVSTEEASRTKWRLDAFCPDEERAAGCAAVIALEAPGWSASVQALEDKDWVAESLKGLPAVEAGPFIVAGAHELRAAPIGKTPIWIEAGPAFGTGHHGTTKGCLEALADIARQRSLGRVLDIGTGSAVLAIAALKSGATSAVATDIDAESLRVAKENARNNKVGRTLRFVHADGAVHTQIRALAPYDVVMANILARPLVKLSPDIAKLTRPGGRIILSGLLTHQEPQLKAAFSGQGLTLVDRRRVGGWSTLVYARSNAPADQPKRASRRARRVSRRSNM
ncbi:MAG: 50S ribosomal protein L11 methyltransferase [Pseudomonadota bacterium]